jgi:hypothetical protein
VKKHWRTLAIAAAAAVIGLSVAAVASGAAPVKDPFRGRAAWSQLMGNPRAVAETQALRAQHRKDMQAWYDKYAADPKSAEAQAALQALRRGHWNEMKALFEKLGIEVPAGAGPGIRGAGGGTVGGGLCGGAGGCGRPASGSRVQGSGYGGGMMGGAAF